MVNPIFDGGLCLAEMIAMDCILDDLTGDDRSEFITEIKTEEPETWVAYVDQKKNGCYCRRIIFS